MMTKRSMRGPRTKDVFAKWRKSGAVTGCIRSMCITLEMDEPVPSICVEGFGVIQVDAAKLFDVEMFNGRTQTNADADTPGAEQ